MFSSKYKEQFGEATTTLGTLNFFGKIIFTALFRKTVDKQWWI